MIDKCGTKKWRDDDGQLHREDGPALIEREREIWFTHGTIHRLDGPAIIWANGDFEWIKDGQLHRLDGPAVNYWNEKEWWIEGKRIHCTYNEEFLRIVKLKMFL
jgi:hypothetical protein